MTDAGKVSLEFAGPERASADYPTEQKKPVKDRSERVNETLVVAEAPIPLDEQAKLAFNEEPVTIIVQVGQEKHAPRVVDCWCNGKGLEIWDGRRWIEIGAAPRGQAFTTKRKYVEILVRSRIDVISTRHGEVGDQRVDNYADRNTVSFAPVQIVRDANPRGADWFEALCRNNY